MKKLISLFTVSFALAALTACGGIQRGEGRYLVDQVTDSILLTHNGNDVLRFDILQASYTNGLIQNGDSVAITYEGTPDDTGKAKALTIALIPKPSSVVEMGVDTSRELITREATEEEIEASNRAMDDVHSTQH